MSIVLNFEHAMSIQKQPLGRGAVFSNIKILVEVTYNINCQIINSASVVSKTLQFNRLDRFFIKSNNSSSLSLNDSV